MAKELSILQQQAEAIKNEKNKGANTSNRIGGMFNDMLDYNEGKFTELEVESKNYTQKIITFKEIPYLSLDDTSSPDNKLFPNDSESSSFIGVVCYPLRNAKYRYSTNTWPYKDSYIRYYKGGINETAIRVYKDTIPLSSRDEITTPDIDFDFAVINLHKFDGELPYPYKSLYLINIDTSDIANSSITNEKIAKAAVTRDKTDCHIALFEYCILAGHNIIPNTTKFTDLSIEEGAWEDGLLKIDGTIDTVITGYKTSKFIDYSAPYSQPFTVLYCNLGNETYSETIYANIAFYNKETHEFIVAYSCLPGKRCILIPRNYSVRISRNAASDGTLLIKSSLMAPSYNFLVDSYNLLQNDYNTNIVPLIKNKSVEELSNSTLVVKITNENVTLDSQIWTYSGKKVDGGLFGTFRFIVPENSKYVDLSNYDSGVYNGAFVKKNGTWISSISNEEDLSNISIPVDAYYVDVTYEKSIGLNKNISFGINNYRFFLPYLGIKPEQIEGNTQKNNQWFGKKICIIGTSVAYGSNAEAAYAKIASERLGFEIVPAGVPGLAIHAKIDEEHGSVLAPLTYGSTCLSKAEYEAAKEAGATNTTIPDTPMPINGEDWRPGDDYNYNSFYRTWENVFSSKNVDVSLWIYAVSPNNTNFDTTDWDNFNKTGWVYNDGKPFEEHRTTFLGALLYLMDKMYTLNPNSRMVFCLDSAFNYEQGKESLKKLSEQWNIPIIDLWGKINTTPKSLKVLKSKNGIDNHPSTFGQERLGDIFTNELLLIS